MNCIIVDDNKLARATLRQLISGFSFLNLTKEFSVSTTAFEYLKAKSPDLVFLDVEMPGMSGIELVKNLEKRPIIIMVTARRDYAVEAFELNLADYLVKPVSLKRFSAAIYRAKELYAAQQKKLKEKQEYIFVRSNSILTRLNSNRIVYMQAAGNQVHIHTTDNRHTVCSNLKSFEQKLPDGKFFKLHNSYLVAIDKIKSVNENSVNAGKYDLPLGRQFRPGLLRKLNLIDDTSGGAREHAR